MLVMTDPQWSRRLAGTVAVALATWQAGCASANTAGTLAADTQVLSTHVPGACDQPAAEHAGELGCYLTAVTPLSSLPDAPLFWHLHDFPTRASAEAARGPHGTVVEAFGRVWLYTIAPEHWSSSGGQRIAAIGPLPVAAGKQYTARYMEATFPPGMQAPAHVHSGAEAWYVLEGAQCLETPRGVVIARAGEGAMVEEGPQMSLVGIGTDTRRAVLLVLHDSAQPWMSLVSDWKPKGLCPR